MKKIVFILAIIVSFCSCSKKEMVIRDGKVVDKDDNNTTVYTWKDCVPKPLTLDKSEFVAGSGVNAIYWYYFHVSLDNSQADATNTTAANIYFPHVGSSGIIYNNVSNDATYEVVKVENGICSFRVKTSNMTLTGCPLKFNLSLLVSGNYIWFSANGGYTQNVGIDDGLNNMYFIVFNNGSIVRGF